MTETWFFPESYLAKAERILVHRQTLAGTGKSVDFSVCQVLIGAQILGMAAHGRDISTFLDKWDIDDENLADFAQRLTGSPKRSAIPSTWLRMQEIYNEAKPTTWPPISKRLKLGKMTSRLEEGIGHAGSIAEFLSLFQAALAKVPEFYRGQYVTKGATKRPATDFILCLLSGDRNHKELGVTGWRMFEWADLIAAERVTNQGAWRHPAEEFCKWTGTAWTHRGPFFALSELEQQQKKRELIEAGLAPADA